MTGKIDLHMHSTCSDGTDSPEELVKKVKDAGIVLFALTDHDTVAGVCRMQELAKENGITCISGVEFSCLIDEKDADSDCHILGLGIDVSHESIQKLVQKNQENRQKKLYEILDYLETFSIRLDPDVIAELAKIHNVGKPAVANAAIDAGYMMEQAEKEIRTGYASSQAKLQAKIRSRAKDLLFQNYLNDFSSLLHISAKEAIEGIRKAGGIAVWAHPIGDKKDTATHDLGFKFATQLKAMMDFGIQGLECCYSRYTEEEIAVLLKTARQHQLLISGGSDYHGKNKDTKLAQTGRDIVHQEEITVHKIWG